jgi:hypothetical protein
MLKQIITCCAAAACLCFMTTIAEARNDSRDSARGTNATAKASVKTVSLANKGSDACPATPPPACTTYKPCVSYCGCCDCCGPKVSQVLKVKDPCDCYCCELAEIPVCLPACCKNPCVCSRCGVFGRGIVTYSYDCCCVTIIFRRCGDVVVKYS